MNWSECEDPEGNICDEGEWCEKHWVQERDYHFGLYKAGLLTPIPTPYDAWLEKRALTQ